MPSARRQVFVGFAGSKSGTGLTLRLCSSTYSPSGSPAGASGGWYIISWITIGPILGDELTAPVPVRNCVTVAGLSTPKLLALVAAYSTPTLVVSLPKE